MAQGLQTKIITITVIIIINMTAAGRRKYHSNMEKMNFYSLMSSMLKKTKMMMVLTMEALAEAIR